MPDQPTIPDQPSIEDFMSAEDIAALSALCEQIFNHTLELISDEEDMITQQDLAMAMMAHGAVADRFKEEATNMLTEEQRAEMAALLSEEPA